MTALMVVQQYQSQFVDGAYHNPVVTRKQQAGHSRYPLAGAHHTASRHTKASWSCLHPTNMAVGARSPAAAGHAVTRQITKQAQGYHCCCQVTAGCVACITPHTTFLHASKDQRNTYAAHAAVVAMEHRDATDSSSGTGKLCRGLTWLQMVAISISFLGSAELAPAK
jgi:hypothetical protein